MDLPLCSAQVDYLVWCVKFAQDISSYQRAADTSHVTAWVWIFQLQTKVLWPDHNMWFTVCVPSSLKSSFLSVLASINHLSLQLVSISCFLFLCWKFWSFIWLAVEFFLLSADWPINEGGGSTAAAPRFERLPVKRDFPQQPPRPGTLTWLFSRVHFSGYRVFRRCRSAVNHPQVRGRWAQPVVFGWSV